MKFIGTKILCLALILNLVIFFIFIVFDACSSSFFKKKKTYFHNNVVYAQPEGNNKGQDNQSEPPKKGFFANFWGGFKNRVSSPNDTKNIKDAAMKEKQSLDAARNSVLDLIKSDPKLKEILDLDETFQKAEKNYQEVETKLKENNFQAASDLLKPPQTWWGSLKNRVPFTDKGSSKSLKDIYCLLNDEFQDTKNIKDAAMKEKQSLDAARNSVLDLIKSDPKLKEILDLDETFQKAEKNYQEVETKLKENNFQAASDLLKPPQTWWGSLKNWVPFTDKGSSKSLKDIYESISVDLKCIQELHLDLNKLNHSNDEKAHASWKEFIMQKISKLRWPSAHADAAFASPNVVPQEKIQIIEDFFKKHPFVTKCLGWFLGEKSNDVSTIASNLTQNLAAFVGNKAKKEVKSEAEIAQKNVSEKATNAVKKSIFGIIASAVALTALVIIFLCLLIIKKIKLKTATK